MRKKATIRLSRIWRNSETVSGFLPLCDEATCFFPLSLYRRSFPVRYLLSTYHVSDTVLGDRDTIVNKTGTVTALTKCPFQWGLGDLRIFPVRVPETSKFLRDSLPFPLPSPPSPSPLSPLPLLLPLPLLVAWKWRGRKMLKK